MNNTHTYLKNLIAEHRVILFMKGSKHFPQCGFSQQAVQILQHLDVDYYTVNVLEKPEIREGVKTFSQWPTIPQLYIDQDFIGGCDIMKEMFSSGELQKLVESLKTE